MPRDVTFDPSDGYGSVYVQFKLTFILLIM